MLDSFLCHIYTEKRGKDLIVVNQQVFQSILKTDAKKRLSAWKEQAFKSEGKVLGLELVCSLKGKCSQMC